MWTCNYSLWNSLGRMWIIKAAEGENRIDIETNLGILPIVIKIKTAE